jgi:hypothetical protein
MLVSQSLLEHGSFALDHYAIPRLNPSQQKGYVSNGSIYQIELIDGHLYYFFPPGSSVLSVPYVALMKVVGLSAANADGTLNENGERRIQRSFAALLMAGLTALFFYTSRLLLSLGWSVLIAFGGALGTQIWSTASRALWSDTWGIFLLGFVIWMLVAQETGKYRIRPVLLASLLAWTYFIRPTYCIPIIAITVYVFAFYRPQLAWYIAAGGAWFAGFVFYSWYHFGQLLPNYYFANRLRFDSFGVALAGNLISPSRGLLVFVPVLIFVAYLLLRYAKELPFIRLVMLCLIIIAAHLIIISGFSPWWGGHCYGPRYTTGLVPWFVLLSILALKARLTWRGKQALKNLPFGWTLEFAIGGILLACSVSINALGAIDHRTSMWNLSPVNVDEQPERVWDWKYPQFLVRWLKP